MDGVLVDSEPFHQKVLENVFVELRLPFSESYHHTLTGMANNPMWDKIITDFNLNKSRDFYAGLHLENVYKTLETAQVPETNGIFSLIDWLNKDGYRLSVASSSPKKLIEIFIGRMGLEPVFDFLVSGEEVANSKPFPDIFLKVADNYQLETSMFLVIEDSKNGVHAAKAAGMKCVGYFNPNSGNQDLSKADLVIDDFGILSAEIIHNLLA